MNQDRTILTEAMLSIEYGDNGIVVKTKEDANEVLKKKGFVMLDGIWRGKGGRTATIYKLRDAILETTWPYPVKKYFPKGFLVSFGGEAKSCYELKFTKILKPKF